MADSFVKLPVGSQRIDHYTSDPSNASPNALSSPCQNMIITDDGKAEQRKGYREEFSIGVDGKPPRGFYHPTYDITFFALGTKLYYYDWTQQVSYDTGITLTDGTVTRFDEVLGDVYLSNTTDGLYRITVTRLNDAAADSGDSTVTIDTDGASRISVFGDIAAGGSSDDLRINGVNEEMASLVVSTGVVTLSGTLSQSYDDNTVAIVVRRYSSLDNPSKILFWKGRMHFLRPQDPTNADQPNNTVLTGKFVIGNVGASTIEDIVAMPLDGTGGSVKITIPGGGATTNILGVADSIYFFTENKVFSTLSSSIATSGAAIGLTIPDEKDGLHGCINEDSATMMGNNALTYITNDKRIMRIPIDTDNGAAIAAPEEDFDVDIRDHLKNMSKDQTGAFAYHYKGGRQTIYQLKIAGQWQWFIFDHNIIRKMGSNFVRGAWQPPQQITPFTNLFERNGVLYGTDVSDDTVYSIFTTFTDNLNPIYAIFATGDFNVGNALVKNVEMQGDINQPSQVEIKCFVTNDNGGRRSGSPKVINGSDYEYGEDNSVGAVPVGDGGVGETTPIAKWKKRFGVFPSEGYNAQLIAENFQDGGYFSVKSYQIDGTQYPSSFSSAL